LAALVGVIVAAGSVSLAFGKRITLVVDGRARQVDTSGATVGEVLDGAGISVGPHDAVEPPPRTPLDEGMEIRVLLGKEITLVLNGKPRTVWVMGGKTVGDVLAEINLRAGRLSYVRPSPASTVEDGEVIVYRAAIAVTVVADGKTLQVITNAPDVAYLLDSLGIVLRGRDAVSPPPGKRLSPQAFVRVVRVRVRDISVEEEIPFATEVRYSADMYEGEEVIHRAGVPGLVRRVFRIRTEDGTEVARTMLSTKVLREPTSQIVVRGTRPRNVQDGVATWYHRNGMVAAHRTLPFGTRVTVMNLANGKQVTVVINDRGPYGPGRIIDLSDDAFSVIAPLSQGTSRVRITW
jgi:uncharacterized protein YabE (DUF348 family)